MLDRAVHAFRSLFEVIISLFKSGTGKAGKRRSSKRFYDKSRESFLHSAGNSALRPAFFPSAEPLPPYAGNFSLPPFVPLDPVADTIATMRKAAAIQIFDLLGLEVVPGQLWRFVAAEVDPGIAVRNFFGAIGLDTDALMKRDTTELRRANELLELLIEIDTCFDRLNPDAIRAVEWAIYSGRYGDVRDAVEIVSLYERVARQSASWFTDFGFPAAADFLADVQSELANPMAATLAEARYAEHIALTISHLIERNLRCQSEHLAHLSSLESIDAKVWRAWADGAAIAKAVVEFASLSETVQTSQLALHDIEILIARLEAINVTLQLGIAAGFRGYSGSHSSGGGKSGSKHSSGAGSSGAGKSRAKSGRTLTQLEQAYVYFGYAAHERPPFEEIKKRRTKKVRDTHPDTGGSHEASQECNHFWDIIKGKHDSRGH